MRRILDFNQGWSFLKEVSDPMQASSENGEPVNLPHTWNALDGQDGGDDYYRGCCCYVKQFERPEMKEGEQVYLEFQGASASASVTVNGLPQGSHDGGYSAFRVNITGALQAFNTVAVAVDNSVNGRVYPQTADFTFYGGIYRDVTMVIVSSGHFDLDYFGSSGIKLTPILVDMAEQDPAGTRQNIAVPTQNSCGIKQGTASDRKAVVTVEAWIKGVTEGEIRVMIEGEGEPETAEIKFDFDAGPGGFRSAAAHRVTAELIIDHPHLWNGRKDPFLYRAAVQLIADGALQDEVTQKFGCRTFYADPQNGFFLNEEPCPLRGVSRHQDREGVGNALTREMHREDMELIAELGANSIRLAHYQHDRYFYDLCDEYGMVVWAEIPYITRHMPEGRENTLGQLRELIVQNYHHPAICFWGISNEISAGGLDGDVLENNLALHELARELDPTRLTAMACAFMLDDQNEMLQITDLTAYNHYFGWYVGVVEDNGIWFDRFHEAHPELAAGLSEYGAEAVLKWQSAAPEKGDYTEQYQALYHEAMLKMIEERPWLWCTYVWNMFDFAADGRDEGGVKGRNNKGLVTFDRKIKKDAFYLYKAYWSGEPFVHITGSRYRNRAEAVTEIKLYSNQDQVELYQNGRPLKEEIPESCGAARHIFRFMAELEPVNEFLARAGETEDRIFVYKTDHPEPSYSMPDAGDVSNWLNELEAVDGRYFSLEDKVGELVQVPEGAALFREFMESYDKKKRGAAAGVQMTEEQRMMTMRSMKLKEIMKRTNTEPEEIKSWLRKLQKIKNS